jgi:predicted nucleic acid-binding protein
MTKKLRIYVDTSVVGGCFDDEFDEASLALFDEIKAGKFILVISSLTTKELKQAPEKVRKVLAELPSEMVEIIPDYPEIIQLRDAYLSANVVGPASSADAQHIAAASVAEVDMVVSWNFKHIVHYDKIAGYHSVNLLNGYKQILIYSPKEVVSS